MKKELVSTLLVVSALSFASAQTSTTTGTTTPPVLPPPVSVGDTRIDSQIRALNQEMEAKIRAIRLEYQTKLKALIGNKKVLIASSATQLREENKERREALKNEMKDKKTELREEMKDKKAELKEEYKDRREDIRGTSTPNGLVRRATTTNANPQGNAWGFFMRFFGQPKVNQ